MYTYTIFVIKTQAKTEDVMLKKNELKRLAKKLNWEIDETEAAVKEYLELPSLVNGEELLRILMTTNNAKERSGEVIVFLLRKLSDKIKTRTDLIEVICDILNIDCCFHALSIFNRQDILKPKSKKMSKSFLVKELLSSLSSQSMINKLKPGQRKFLEPEELAYRFLDTFVVTLVMVESEETNKRIGEPGVWWNIIIDVVGRVGFKAFNITIFKNFVTLAAELTYVPAYERYLERLIEALNDPFFNKTEMTKKRYWFIYVLVEGLREKGLGLRESFRRANKLLNIPRGTIQTRYFEIKKEVKVKKLSLKHIIREHHLYRSLNEVLNNEI